MILDEPTATLTERETKRLFDIIAGIKAKGVTVVFVSHHLDEVFAICDRVTVFRNGKTITTEQIADTTPPDIVRFMVGRTLDTEMAGTHQHMPAQTSCFLSKTCGRWKIRYPMASHSIRIRARS